MTTQEITIKGTHCAACARVITRDLAKEGVAVQRIDIKTGKATIEHADVSKRRIADALARRGYTLSDARKAPITSAAPTASVEHRIITAGLGAITILIILQWLFLRYIAPSFPTWNPKYLAPLLLLAIAIGVNLMAIWHQRAYRREVSCMTGMMVGMTIGMSTGFMVGAIAGLLNGMFWGATIGILVGIPAGVYAGRCCGIMGAMEGIMAGFMGGTMGAMLTVMMLLEHPVVFIAITIAVNGVALAGLMRVIAQEHEGTDAKVAPWPAWIAITIATAIMLVTTTLILLLPRGLY